jgi:hypothetical protein
MHDAHRMSEDPSAMSGACEPASAMPHPHDPVLPVVDLQDTNTASTAPLCLLRYSCRVCQCTQSWRAGILWGCEYSLYCLYCAFSCVHSCMQSWMIDLGDRLHLWRHSHQVHSHTQSCCKIPLSEVSPAPTAASLTLVKTITPGPGSCPTCE